MEGEGSTRKRKQNAASSEQVKQLRLLCHGDTVTFKDAAGEDASGQVYRVDKYKKEIEVSLAGESTYITVPVHTLSIKELEPEIQTNRRNRPQTTGKKSNTHTAPSISCQNDVQTQTEIEREGNVAHPLCFQDGELIMSGGTCSLEGNQNILFGITEISDYGNGIMAKGDLIINGAIDKDIKIMAPVEKVKTASVCLAKKDRDHLSKFSLMDSISMQSQLADAPATLRRQIRMSQVAFVIRREVHSALKSKNLTRRFSLGVCSIEHDLSILGLESSRKSVFSYKQKTIQDLDKFLGNMWDVMSLDANQFKFVTQVIFRIRNFVISGCIFVSHSLSGLTPEYRQQLIETELTAPAMEEENFSDDDEY